MHEEASVRFTQADSERCQVITYFKPFLLIFFFPFGTKIGRGCIRASGDKMLTEDLVGNLGRQTLAGWQSHGCGHLSILS